MTGGQVGFHLEVPASRAAIFTGATRNSLVVLPLAVALPDNLAVAAVVLVTQTLAEVLGMVTYVRFIPRLVPQRQAARWPARLLLMVDEGAEGRADRALDNHPPVRRRVVGTGTGRSPCGDRSSCDRGL